MLPQARYKHTQDGIEWQSVPGDRLASGLVHGHFNGIQQEHSIFQLIRRTKRWLSVPWDTSLMGRYFPPVLYSTLKRGRVRSTMAINTWAYHRYFPGPRGTSRFPSLTADGSGVKQMGGNKSRKIGLPVGWCCCRMLVELRAYSDSARFISSAQITHGTCRQQKILIHPQLFVIHDVYFVCDCFGHRNSRTESVIISVLRSYLKPMNS